MSKKIYLIKHVYDTDGGFGDAVSQEEVLFATDNKKLAKAYVKKYSKPVVYASPYADLYHHELVIEKLKLEEPDLDVPPWSEDDGYEDDYEDYEEE